MTDHQKKKILILKAMSTLWYPFAFLGLVIAFLLIFPMFFCMLLLYPLKWMRGELKKISE